MNSFSADVKKELSEINNLSKKELVKAELYGYLLTNKSQSFTTQSEYNINRYGKLLTNIGINDFDISISGKNYIIKTKKEIKNTVKIESLEEKKAVVRGAFMGAGTISKPNKKYHLEIVFDDEQSANYVKQIIEEQNVISKIINREKKSILYIEDGEMISEFLAFIGANKSVLDFENERVLKNVRNNVNRLVNCETANLSKTVSSSVKQIEDIKYIKSKKKFNNLSEKEQEIANIRLKNSNMSLQNLGKLTNPPISKSGVKHRLFPSEIACSQDIICAMRPPIFLSSCRKKDSAAPGGRKKGRQTRATLCSA